MPQTAKEQALAILDNLPLSSPEIALLRAQVLADAPGTAETVIRKLAQIANVPPEVPPVEEAPVAPPPTAAPIPETPPVGAAPEAPPAPGVPPPWPPPLAPQQPLWGPEIGQLGVPPLGPVPWTTSPPGAPEAPPREITLPRIGTVSTDTFVRRPGEAPAPAPTGHPLAYQQAYRGLSLDPLLRDAEGFAESIAEEGPGWWTVPQWLTTSVPWIQKPMDVGGELVSEHLGSGAVQRRTRTTEDLDPKDITRILDVPSAMQYDEGKSPWFDAHVQGWLPEHISQWDYVKMPLAQKALTHLAYPPNVGDLLGHKIQQVGDALNPAEWLAKPLISGVKAVGRGAKNLVKPVLRRRGQHLGEAVSEGAGTVGRPTSQFVGADELPWEPISTQFEGGILRQAAESAGAEGYRDVHPLVMQRLRETFDRPGSVAGGEGVVDLARNGDPTALGILRDIEQEVLGYVDTPGGEVLPGWELGGTPEIPRATATGFDTPDVLPATTWGDLQRSIPVEDAAPQAASPRPSTPRTGLPRTVRSPIDHEGWAPGTPYRGVDPRLAAGLQETHATTADPFKGLQLLDDYLDPTVTGARQQAATQAVEGLYETLGLPRPGGVVTAPAGRAAAAAPPAPAVTAEVVPDPPAAPKPRRRRPKDPPPAAVQPETPPTSETPPLTVLDQIIDEAAPPASTAPPVTRAAEPRKPRQTQAAAPSPEPQPKVEVDAPAPDAAVVQETAPPLKADTPAPNYETPQLNRLARAAAKWDPDTIRAEINARKTNTFDAVTGEFIGVPKSPAAKREIEVIDDLRRQKLEGKQARRAAAQQRAAGTPAAAAAPPTKAAAKQADDVPAAAPPEAPPAEATSDLDRLRENVKGLSDAELQSEVEKFRALGLSELVDVYEQILKDRGAATRPGEPGRGARPRTVLPEDPPMTAAPTPPAAETPAGTRMTLGGEASQARAAEARAARQLVESEEAARAAAEVPYEGRPDVIYRGGDQGTPSPEVLESPPVAPPRQTTLENFLDAVDQIGSPSPSQRAKLLDMWERAKQGDQAALRGVGQVLHRQATGKGTVPDISVEGGVQVAPGALSGIHGSDEAMANIAERAAREAEATGFDIVDQSVVAHETMNQARRGGTAGHTTKTRSGPTGTPEQMGREAESAASAPYRGADAGPNEKLRDVLVRNTDLDSDTVSDMIRAAGMDPDELTVGKRADFEKRLAEGGDPRLNEIAKALTRATKAKAKVVVDEATTTAGLRPYEDFLNKVYTGQPARVAEAVETFEKITRALTMSDAGDHDVVKALREATDAFWAQSRLNIVHLIDQEKTVADAFKQFLDDPDWRPTAKALAKDQPTRRVSIIKPGATQAEAQGLLQASRRGKPKRPSGLLGDDEFFTAGQSPANANPRTWAQAEDHMRYALTNDVVGVPKGATDSHVDGAFIRAGLDKETADRAFEILRTSTDPEVRSSYLQYMNLVYYNLESVRSAAMMRGMLGRLTQMSRDPKVIEQLQAFVEPWQQLAKLNEDLYTDTLPDITRWANAFADTLNPPDLYDLTKKFRQDGRKPSKFAERGQVKIPAKPLGPLGARGPRALQGPGADKRPRGLKKDVRWPDAPGPLADSQIEAAFKNPNVFEAMGKFMGASTGQLKRSSEAGFVTNEFITRLFPSVLTAHVGASAGKQVAEQQGYGPEAQMGATVAGGLGGLLFGSQLPKFFRKISPKGAPPAAKLDAFVMTNQFMSPRSLTRAVLGGHNGALVKSIELGTEGLLRMAKGGVTGDTAEITRGKKQAWDSLRTAGTVLEEDLKLLTFGKDTAGRPTSIFKTMFDLDLTDVRSMEALEAKYPEVVQYFKDTPFEQIMDDGKFDANFSDSLVAKVFRSADWGGQAILMQQGDVPFREAQRATFQGPLRTQRLGNLVNQLRPYGGDAAKLRGEDPGIAQTWKELATQPAQWLPFLGQAGANTARRAVTLTPRMLGHQLESGAERTIGPGVAAYRKLTGRPTPEGSLFDMDFAEGGAKLASGLGAGALGFAAGQLGNPVLTPWLSTAMGQAGLPYLMGNALGIGSREGVREQARQVWDTLQGEFPVNLDNPLRRFSDPARTFTDLYTPGAALHRDMGRILSPGAPGPETGRAAIGEGLRSGALDTESPAGRLLAQIHQQPGGDFLTGGAASILQGVPNTPLLSISSEGLLQRPPVNLNLFGEQMYPVDDWPTLGAQRDLPQSVQGVRQRHDPATTLQAGREYIEGVPGPQTIGEGALGLLKHGLLRTMLPVHQGMRLPPPADDPALQGLRTLGGELNPIWPLNPPDLRGIGNPRIQSPTEDRAVPMSQIPFAQQGRAIRQGPGERNRKLIEAIRMMQDPAQDQSGRGVALWDQAVEVAAELNRENPQGPLITPEAVRQHWLEIFLGGGLDTLQPRGDFDAPGQQSDWTQLPANRR
jgi:hypothetical protein